MTWSRLTPDFAVDITKAAAMKIPLNIGRSTSRRSGWGNLGLQVERLPGGHLTTNEQPEALAALIAKFERGLAKMLGFA